MKTLFALTAAVALMAPMAHASDAAVLKPIHQMVEAFNKGDAKAAKATHVASPSITDEIAPFFWTGPKAFDSWLTDLSKAEAAEGKTDGVVALDAPTLETVTGNRAYVITPSTYTFKQKGRTMREVGTMTFVLLKGASGWKVKAWTWTSPEAQPAN
jgi:ketosteroid isomerase-like protein